MPVSPLYPITGGTSASCGHDAPTYKLAGSSEQIRFLWQASYTTAVVMKTLNVSDTQSTPRIPWKYRATVSRNQSSVQSFYESYPSNVLLLRATLVVASTKGAIPPNVY